MKTFTAFMEDGSAPVNVTAGIAGVKSGDQPPISRRIQKKIQNRIRTGMPLLRRRFNV